MGKSIETIKKFHKAWNDKNLEAIGSLLTDDTVYEGPLVTWKGKKQYLEGAKEILQGFAGMKVLQQFEDGNTVFTIEEILVNTPDGKVILQVAEVNEIKGDKISKAKTFYDPRSIAKYCAPAQN
jgi:limonene-1,2-epoxide hydrolase